MKPFDKAFDHAKRFYPSFSTAKRVVLMIEAELEEKLGRAPNEAELLGAVERHLDKDAGCSQ